MTEENKTETEVKVEEIVRGVRGEVGTASASQTIKQMWRQTHCRREDVNDNLNPRKRIWIPNRNAPSLKAFARTLLKEGNQVAKDWFAHKGGSENAQRTEKNAARVQLERQASKNARRKTGKGGKASA